MLVLYMLHASETGVLRFNEIRRLMTDCSQKMLSQTLKNLEQRAIDYKVNHLCNKQRNAGRL